MSKDLAFHLTDEQWQAILSQLGNGRIADLEAEVERLKGERETLAGFLTTTLRKAAEGTPLEFPRSPWPEECWVKTTIMPPVQEPKKCGCGASVRVPMAATCGGPWTWHNEGTPWCYLKDGQYCPDCGEELKA